jgi:MoxR-like ATPase
MENLHKTLNHIKESMDQFVIGHDDIKEAILLGLIGREHVYIEGPPGTAKTMLAEIAAKAANLQFFFYQLNRDTRLSELIGDYVIHREREDKSEMIRQDIVRGRILTADICVLDDISRAPGEALNVLLRVLNERKFGKERIPLLTTIATGNPARDDYYNEPLDLANLDRFTLQLRVVGLIQKNEWDLARQVIDFYATHDFDNATIEPASSDSLKADRDILLRVTLPEAVKEMLIGLPHHEVRPERQQLPHHRPDFFGEGRENAQGQGDPGTPMGGGTAGPDRSEIHDHVPRATGGSREGGGPHPRGRAKKKR